MIGMAGSGGLAPCELGTGCGRPASLAKGETAALALAIIDSYSPHRYTSIDIAHEVHLGIHSLGGRRERRRLHYWSSRQAGDRPEYVHQPGPEFERHHCRTVSYTH